MPSASPNPIPDSLQSMKDIQWLDPIELDLSLFDDEIGKQRLSNQLAKAVRTNGFFTVENSGIPKEMIEQQFKLSRGFFELPLEEKLPYHNKEAYTAGDQTGYKPSDVRLKLTNKNDVQIYNIPRQDGFHKPAQPEIFEDHIKEIASFQQEAIEKVVQKLLRLLAIVLELPDENQLAQMNDFAMKGEDIVRYIKYSALPADEVEGGGGMYGGSHADMSTFTLNFRQPVAALQILDADENWKWVKPWEDTIMVNVGSTLTALTGGYVKSGIHRVHAPPKEQIHLDRLAVLFVARGNSDFVMESIKNSPVLQRADKETLEGVDQGLTMDKWGKVWMTYMRGQFGLKTAKAAAST